MSSFLQLMIGLLKHHNRILLLEQYKGELMEKYYRDYEWNLNCARYWYKLIGKDKMAKSRHQAHLKIARAINEEFKLMLKSKH